MLAASTTPIVTAAISAGAALAGVALGSVAASRREREARDEAARRELNAAALRVLAGVNSELARWVGSPIRASFVSFAVGTIALFLLSVSIFKPLPSGARLAEAPWWVWVGGGLGALYVAAAIVTAPRLGAATL